MSVLSGVQASHPEQNTGEVFLGYHNCPEFNTLEWKSKRKGKICYDDAGGIVGQDRMLPEDSRFPVFVARSEIEQDRLRNTGIAA